VYSKDDNLKIQYNFANAYLVLLSTFLTLASFFSEEPVGISLIEIEVAYRRD
jgi:hypothetical protein